MHQLSFIIKSLAIVLQLFSATISFAQYYLYNPEYYSSDIVVEAGCSAGAINSLTDLGGRKGVGRGFIKDLNWEFFKPVYGGYLVALFRNVAGVRIEASKGIILSDDGILKKKDPDLSGRYARNLSVKTSITDFQITAEIHPLYFREYEEYELPVLSPSIIAGIGYFIFNPRAQLNGKWYDLHPLRLEGQGFTEYPGRKQYKLKQLSLPLGAGLRYEITSLINARIDFVYRILFTDYLDDVSDYYIDPDLFIKYLGAEKAAIATRLYSRMEELQPGYKVNTAMPRGNKNDRDAFFTAQLKIGMTIRSKRR